jgi:hypothetical protein
MLLKHQTKRLGLRDQEVSLKLPVLLMRKSGKIGIEVNIENQYNIIVP